MVLQPYVGRRGLAASYHNVERAIARFVRNNPELSLAGTAAAGATGLAKLAKASGLSKAYRGGKSSTGRKYGDPTVSQSKSTKKRVWTSRYGGTYQQVKKRRKQRRKKTLKKRIVSLEKNAPKKTTKKLCSLRNYHCVVPQITRGYYEIHTLDHNDIESLITTIRFASGVEDLTTINSEVKIKHYSKMKIINSSLYKCTVRVQKLKCSDYTNVSPLANMKNEATDRGVSTGAIAPEVAATTTSSTIPRTVLNESPQHFYKMLSWTAQGDPKKYEQIGDIETVHLNPGDDTNIYFSRSMTYKPEVKDSTTDTFLKNYDYFIIFEVIGELGFDRTNNAKIGRTQTVLNIEHVYNNEVTVVNGIGTNSINTAVNDNYTGMYMFEQAGADNVIE